MPSLPWGIIVLMILAIILYLQGFQKALTVWRLSLDMALIIILLLITANFLTIPFNLGNVPVNLHVGSLLLFVFAVLLWYFQGGRARLLWLAAGIGIAAAVLVLNVFSQSYWTAVWLDTYWLLPLLAAALTAILTRNMSGVVFITVFSLLVGQAATSFYYNLTAGTWLALGSKNTFDMAVLGAVLSGLLVAIAQLLAMRRFVYRQKHLNYK